VAAGLGGRAVMGIFTIGTMLWYIMDAMQYREGAFSVVRSWGCMCSSHLQFTCWTSTVSCNSSSDSRQLAAGSSNRVQLCICSK
jgi:hypothetical protein